jgi:hypothetical protein
MLAVSVRRITGCRWANGCFLEEYGSLAAVRPAHITSVVYRQGDSVDDSDDALKELIAAIERRRGVQFTDAPSGSSRDCINYGVPAHGIITLLIRNVPEGNVSNGMK